MGVKSCSISDCESIMCDTYVDGVGYICTDCQERFIEWSWNNAGDIRSDTGLKTLLNSFKGLDLINAMPVDRGKHIRRFFQKFTQ